MSKFKIFVALFVASSFVVLPGMTQEVHAKGKFKNFLKNKLNPLGARMERARNARKDCEKAGGSRKDCRKDSRRAFFKRENRSLLMNKGSQ
ncbi:MAG: hypothetical protein JNL01_15070 [Bdellovibrionales bacterium]|nr:hypothetical protein [Bdellovibrionales bacterium]